MIGAMKAKEDARNTGTWPRVTIWKISVPRPAVNSATLGSRPVKQRHQHQRAEGDKQHLGADKGLFRGEFVIGSGGGGRVGVWSLVAVMVSLLSQVVYLQARTGVLLGPRAKLQCS